MSILNCSPCIVCILYCANWIFKIVFSNLQFAICNMQLARFAFSNLHFPFCIVHFYIQFSVDSLYCTTYIDKHYAIWIVQIALCILHFANCTVMKKLIDRWIDGRTNGINYSKKLLYLSRIWWVPDQKGKHFLETSLHQMTFFILWKITLGYIFAYVLYLFCWTR